MRDEIKSVLLINFGSVFRHLGDINQNIAMFFAQNLGEISEKLHGDNLHRNYIYKAVYASMGHYIKTGETLDNGQEKRIYFSSFIGDFAKNGFIYNNCVIFNVKNKSSIDMNIVVDILKDIDGRFEYDELVIMGGDSDFVPLLQYIRAKGKRIVLVNDERTELNPQSSMVTAYHSYEHLYELIDSIMPNEQHSEIFLGATKKTTRLVEAAKIIKEAVVAGDRPILMTVLEKDHLGEFNEDKSWNGYRTMTGFVTAALNKVGHNNLIARGGWIWDTEKHQEPEPTHSSNFFNFHYAPEIIQNAMKITFFPKIDMEHWDRVLDGFAEYFMAFPNENSVFSTLHSGLAVSFQMSQCTMWVQEYLARRDINIGRGKLYSVIFTIKNGEMNISNRRRWPLTTEIIKNLMRDAIIKKTMSDFKNTSKEDVSETDKKQLEQWIKSEYKPTRHITSDDNSYDNSEWH